MTHVYFKILLLKINSWTYIKAFLECILRRKEQKNRFKIIPRVCQVLEIGPLKRRLKTSDKLRSAPAPRVKCFGSDEKRVLRTDH